MDTSMFIGIGLNLDNEKPTACLNAVLKEINSGSLCLRREDILASFFNKFENLFEVFLDQGKLLHDSFILFFYLTINDDNWSVPVYLC